MRIRPCAFAAHAVALVLAAVAVAAPVTRVAAQPGGARTFANVYERQSPLPGQALEVALLCGTGLLPGGLVPSFPVPVSTAACAGGLADGRVAGASLRAYARIDGLGVEAVGPVDPGRSPEWVRVAQAGASFEDALTFGITSGTWRVFYRLTGARREVPAAAPPGWTSGALATGATVAIARVGTVGTPIAAGPGTSDETGHVDLPFAGGTLDWYVSLSAFARVRAPLVGSTAFLGGLAESDFANTLAITRVAVLDAGGADVTGAVTVGSVRFRVGPGGTLTTVPEPGTLALAALGLVLLGAAARRGRVSASGSPSRAPAPRP